MDRRILGRTKYERGPTGEITYQTAATGGFLAQQNCATHNREHYQGQQEARTSMTNHPNYPSPVVTKGQ
jgi:hypothetical protein